MDNLFQMGDFIFHSGIKSNTKIECDALKVEDWQTLAYIASKQLPAFNEVRWVESGGRILAGFMHPYRSPEGALLICDDVMTTGGSMDEERSKWGREADTIGLVVFSYGVRIPWIYTMFPLWG